MENVEIHEATEDEWSAIVAKVQAKHGPCYCSVCNYYEETA